MVLMYFNCWKKIKFEKAGILVWFSHAVWVLIHLCLYLSAGKGKEDLFQSSLVHWVVLHTEVLLGWLHEGEDLGQLDPCVWDLKVDVALLVIKYLEGRK